MTFENIKYQDIKCKILAQFLIRLFESFNISLNLKIRDYRCVNSIKFSKPKSYYSNNICKNHENNSILLIELDGDFEKIYL